MLFIIQNIKHLDTVFQSIDSNWLLERLFNLNSNRNCNLQLDTKIAVTASKKMLPTWQIIQRNKNQKFIISLFYLLHNEHYKRLAFIFTIFTTPIATRKTSNNSTLERTPRDKLLCCGLLKVQLQINCMKFGFMKHSGFEVNFHEKKTNEKATHY